MSPSDPQADTGTAIRITASTSHAPGAAARTGEPFTVGVPMPRGTGDAGWCLVDDAGRRRAVQTRALDRWPDGSVRCLLVDGRVDVGADARGGVWLTPDLDGAALRAETGIAIDEHQGVIVVDTGAARFEVRAGGAFPFESVTSGGAHMVAPGRSGLALEDDSGGNMPLAIEAVKVVEAGPLRATVSYRGAFRTNGQVRLEVRARAELYAGLATARVSVTVRNPEAAGHPDGFWDLGSAGSVYIKDLSLTIALPGERATAAVDYSPEIGSAWQTAPLPFELYQDSSGGDNWKSSNHMNRHRVVPNRLRGYTITAGDVQGTGLRATPVVSLTSATGRLSVTVPHFWQNFPKAATASNQALSVGIFPRQYGDVHEMQGGEQKTHEVCLAFGPETVTERPLEWCRARAHVVVDPAWAVASAAEAWLSAAEASRGRLIAAAVEGDDTFERKREVVDEYGWRHFGDVYGDHEGIRRQAPPPLVSHYNNQYDTLAGFTYQFLSTGDRRWWTLMRDLSAHVVDIDIYHTTRDKAAYNHGLFWHTYHYGDADTAGHRTYPRAGREETGGGGPSADHNYTTGLMLQYFLTGDDAAREAAIDLAQYVIDLDDGRKTVLRWLTKAETGKATASEGYRYHGPGRGPANSLNVLLDGHRLTGEARFLVKAESLLRRVVHPADDIAAMELDEPERRWFYTMFLQSLGKYLEYKAERNELDEMYAYGRASLLHYARWMAEHEYPYLEKPEKLTFPTETWAAQDIRKSDIFYMAALHADGEERARFLERAAFFFRVSVETLQASPTRALARPVIVLLSSGRLHSWFAHHPEAAAPRPRVEPPDFGTPTRFVSQKDRAKQRIVALGIGGAALVAAAILAAFLGSL
jgi:hypothetical protein